MFVLVIGMVRGCGRRSTGTPDWPKKYGAGCGPGNAPRAVGGEAGRSALKWPNEVGAYAAALAVYQGLTGESPVGLPSTLRQESGAEVRLDPAVARMLQESAVVATSVVR